MGEISTLVDGVAVLGPTNGTQLYSLSIDGTGNIFFVAGPPGSTTLYEVPRIDNRYYNTFAPLSAVGRVHEATADRAGNLYVVGDGSISRFPAVNGSFGVFGTPTLVASLASLRLTGDQIEAISVDQSGTVFIATATGQYNENSIQKIALQGATYGTPSIVLSDNAGIGEINGLTVDSRGNLFATSRRSAPGVSTQYAFKIEFSSAGYSQPRFLGDGQITSPVGITANQAGDVFIADLQNSSGAVIRLLKPTYGGNYAPPVLYARTSGPLISGSQISNPLSIDAGGALYSSVVVHTAQVSSDSLLGKIDPSPDFGDTQFYGHTPIRKLLTFAFDAAGTLKSSAVTTQGIAGLEFTDAGTGTCTTNGPAHLYAQGDSCTLDVKFAPTHPGTRYGGVQLTNSAGTPLATANLRGIGNGPLLGFRPEYLRLPSTGLTDPSSVAVDVAGALFVADAKAGLIVRLGLTNLGDFAPPTTVARGLAAPGGIALDGSGNLYVPETATGLVKKIPLLNGSYGQAVTIASGLAKPKSVAVDGLGNLYVTNSGKGVVEKINYSNGSYGARDTLPHGFVEPSGIAVDGNGNVFVTDAGNGALKEIPYISGTYRTPVTIHNGFLMPGQLAISGNGSLYVAETGRSAIREIPNIIREYPETGSYFGPPLTLGTNLLYPLGVAVDASGSLYITDQSKQLASRTRQLDSTIYPYVRFNPTPVGSSSLSNVRSVTLVNNGNQVLVIEYPFRGSGVGNPSRTPDFSQIDSDCAFMPNPSDRPGELRAGDSCRLTPHFTPTHTGLISSIINISDNSQNDQNVKQDIYVSGTGTQP